MSTVKIAGLVLSALTVLIGTYGVLHDNSAEERTAREKARKRRVVIAIAILGAFLSLGTLLTSGVNDAQAASDATADAIYKKTEATRTEDILELAHACNHEIHHVAEMIQVMPLDKASVSIGDPLRGSELLARVRKGDRDAFARYATTPGAGPRYLELQAGETYTNSMLLAFLWATPASVDGFAQLLQETTSRAAVERFIEAHGIPATPFAFVVFVDRSGTATHYIDARAFAIEILSRRLHDEVETHEIDPARFATHPVERDTDTLALVQRAIAAGESTVVVRSADGRSLRALELARVLTVLTR